MNLDKNFPDNIEIGDELLIRAKVVLTHIHGVSNRYLLVEFRGGETDVEIPLTAAFGIITLQ